MAEEGASLVLVDLKAEALEAARGEMAEGTNVTGVAADVSDLEQVLQFRDARDFVVGRQRVRGATARLAE